MLTNNNTSRLNTMYSHIRRMSRFEEANQSKDRIIFNTRKEVTIKPLI